MTRKTDSPAPTRRDPEGRRRAIVDAAARLFAADGYAATSTARIARTAGLAEGTLFHHFPSKRALLAAVADEEGARVLSVAFEGLDPQHPPDVAPLLGRLFAYARAHPGAYRVFLMDEDADALAAGFSAKRSRIVGGLSALLAAWSARGFVRRLDPDVVAELLFALVDTTVRRLLLEDRWHEEAAWTQELTRTIDALLAEHAPSDSTGDARP